MPDCLGFLVGFGDVVELDLDFKFAPAGFAYFEGFAGLCLDVCILLVSFFLLRGAQVIEARQSGGMYSLLNGLGIDSCSLNCTFFSQ